MRSPRVPSRGQPLSATQFLPPSIELSEAEGDSRALLRCSGELDTACAAELGAALDSACEREIAELLLDFGAVSFIDGRILALIEQTRIRLEDCGAALRIRAEGQPLRLLRLTGVGGVDAEPAPRFEAWRVPSSSSSSPTTTSAQPGVTMTP